MAMAPALILALVATTAAGAVVITRMAEGYPGIENPGQPLAGAAMECMTPPEAAAFLAAHGYATVDWQVESGTVLTPDGGKGSSTSVHVSTPPAHGYVIPGSLLAGRDGDHGRRPARRRDRGRRLLRAPDAVTSIDTTTAMQGRPRRRDQERPGCLRGRRPAALRKPRPSARARSGGRARCRGHRPGRVPQGLPVVAAVRRRRRPGLALHHRAAARVQPPPWPATVAGGHRAGRGPAIGGPGRPGPVGRDRQRSTRGPLGAPAQRRRRLHAGRDRPRCWPSRKARSRAGSRAAGRRCDGPSTRLAERDDRAPGQLASSSGSANWLSYRSK